MELLPTLAAGSVDLVLCDLPYGITDCRWDKIIPFPPLLAEYSRVLKPNGALLLFGQGYFAVRIASEACDGLKFRYEWIWMKNKCTGFQNANRMPLRRHENILVFYRRLPTFHPQGVVDVAQPKSRNGNKNSEVYGLIRSGYTQRKTGYPNSVLAFDVEAKAAPCQKPVDLLSYLIRTYTDPGETVLDNCMGTGSTGVAAVQTNRHFIGMEFDPDRFAIATGRVLESAKGRS